MSHNYTKTLNACPYCHKSVFNTGNSFSPRPDRTVRQCNDAACLKWSVRLRNGMVYPMCDPTDKNSTPCSNSRCDH